MDKRLVTKTLGNVVLLTFPNGSSIQLYLITFKKTAYKNRHFLPPFYRYTEKDKEKVYLLSSNEIHHLGGGGRIYIPQLKIHSTLYCQK